ncbi:sensor histidine kinase [Micromonospora chersina]|uniref:sensor histidine kinase n=1 Tax=Micromonospora chersina TaxID=47854 RepID=UPI003695395A
MSVSDLDQLPPPAGAGRADGARRSRPAGAVGGPGFRTVDGVKIWDRLAGTAADLGFVVAFLMALGVEAVAIAQTWGARYWLFGGLAAVVVCVLALLRRWHRGWLAVAGLVAAACTMLVARLAHLPAEPGPAMALALAVLVGAALRTLPPVPAGAVAAADLALVVGSQFATRTSPSAITSVAALGGLAWLGAVAVGLSLRLVDARNQATAEKVRQDERLELARELHDVVTHHITGIVVQAQAAQLVAGKHPEKLPATLAGIELAGSDALAAMRRVVGLLRDTEDAAPASPGPEQLSALVERFNRHGPPVRLRVPEPAAQWPPEVTTTVYRIVQESLTNVSRHAPHARSVTVTVGQDAQGISVEVVDDAPPGPARKGHRSGYGLVGMRERVQTLGGTLRTGPRAGGGWSVLATLPLPSRTAR